MAGQIGVFQMWLGGGVEAEGDGSDDVAASVGGVEDALAVGKAALGVGQFHETRGCQVECADRGNGFGDLLPVGAYVLDGSSADGAGDSGEALDAADSLLAGGEDECVPLHAGGDGGFDG